MHHGSAGWVVAHERRGSTNGAGRGATLPRLRLSVIVGACVALVAADRVASADDAIVAESNIVYGKGGDTELKLDLYRPANQNEKLPGIIVIHGGAWRAGKKEDMRGFAEHVAKAGYVTASVQYRLCPKHAFPAQIEDVKCAVRWLRRHADDYHVDKQRIGAMGGSAGGHLSLLLGVMDAKDGLEGSGGWPDQSSKVQAVVNYFGPTDLTQTDFDEKIQPLLVDFIGGPLAERRMDYEKASPVSYLDPKDAPTLSFHGTKDNIVPFTQAELFDKAFKGKMGIHRLEVMTDKGHGWGGKDLEHTQKMTVEFFDQKLKGKAGAAN
jgi:acetyl esterase/lipase